MATNHRVYIPQDIREQGKGYHGTAIDKGISTACPVDFRRRNSWAPPDGFHRR